MGGGDGGHAPEAEDIVRRALAILDEEVRAWLPLTRPPPLPPLRPEGTPAPGTGGLARAAEQPMICVGCHSENPEFFPFLRRAASLSARPA